MDNILPPTAHQLREILRNQADSTPEKVSIFFKTGPGEYAQHDRFMGITVPVLRRIAQKFLSISLEDLAFLMQSPLNEERLCALIILTAQYKRSKEKEKIYDFYRENLRYVNNWNLVDSSAHHIMGAHLFLRDRSPLETLAISQSIWDRRIAMVATWYFIKQSDLDWTFKIATVLRHDPHDLIHKAVGWMLREAGKKDVERLICFLCTHQMPKTTLRYAVERLSKDQKIRINSLRKSLVKKELHPYF